MPIERDRAEMMRAYSRIVGADDHDDLGQVLALRLDAAQFCKLVANFDPDQEDESLLPMTLPVLVNWLLGMAERSGPNSLNFCLKRERSRPD